MADPVVIFLRSGTIFNVPVDWNNDDNTIECIGGGASGGAGGDYAKISNLTLTPGNNVIYAVGAGGSGGSAGGDTWFNGMNAASASVVAKGGGRATTSVGDVVRAGGPGGTTDIGGGGGGGAGGPSGVGARGGNGASVTGGGGGGGGANGGSAGGDAVGGTGGAGGNGPDGTGGGAANGGAGSNGGGGGGRNADGGPGGSGGTSVVWIQTSDSATAGPGGGGGGGGAGPQSTGGAGGRGANYGGGGGRGGLGKQTRGASGSGGQGIIVITYTPKIEDPIGGTDDDPVFGFFRVRSILGEVTETVRHCTPAAYNPVELDAIPDIESIDQTPAVLSLGENMGTRARVNITFMDHPHAERGEFFLNGTYWGRFRARDLFRRGVEVRVKTGLLEHEFTEYETRYYFLDNFEGLSADGIFSILAQDLLKFADHDRAQAPRASQGFLLSDLASNGTSFSVGPTGIGSTYPSSGYVAIGGKEIVQFSRSGDSFTVTGGTSGRGQFGTQAIAHSAQDRVQICLIYNGATASDIIYDLLTTYADVPTSVIDKAEWDEEVSNHLGVVYSRVIAEPTAVKNLIDELIEQAGLILWWDNLAKKVKFQVLKGIVTDTFTYDNSNIIEDTIEVEEQRDKLITEVWTYYGIRNPLESLSEPTNYRSVLVYTSGEHTTLHGSPVIKKIFGTWIPAFGQITADRTNLLHAGRFLKPPRRVAFSIPRHAGVLTPQEAGGYQFSYYGSQDEAGNRVSFPIQVVKVEPMPDRFNVEAEEMLFAQFDPIDLTNRVITIDSDIYNINLRQIHDTIFPALTEADVSASPSISVTFIINSGVVVGSTTNSQPALNVGNWPNGFVPKLIVKGRIQGRGGNGRSSLSRPSTIHGGPALYTRHPIILDLTQGNGQIWGGGGGGGIGLQQGYIWPGGGGAGANPGLSGGTPVVGSAAQPGTRTRGGNGANAGGFPFGGGGGGPGQAGFAGLGNDGSGIGGNAGRAIDGNSFVTRIGTGDIRGPTAN